MFVILTIIILYLLIAIVMLLGMCETVRICDGVMAVCVCRADL